MSPSSQSFRDTPRNLLLLCLYVSPLFDLGDSFFQMESSRSNALWTNISKQLVIDDGAEHPNPPRPLPEAPHAHELERVRGKRREDLRHTTSMSLLNQRTRPEKKNGGRRQQRKRNRHLRTFDGKVEDSHRINQHHHLRLHDAPRSSLSVKSSTSKVTGTDVLPFPIPDRRTKAVFDHTPPNPLYEARRGNRLYENNREDLLSHTSVLYGGGRGSRRPLPPLPSGNCCVRKVKFKNIGYDTYGRPVEVDVGECSRQCPFKKENEHAAGISLIPPPFVSKAPSIKPRFLYGRDRYRRDISSIETPTNHESEGADVMCDAASSCFPVRKKIERWHLLNGLVEAEVVDDCACATPPDTCMRLPMIKIFHPNSPYERRVDVGKCGGTCFETGTQCTPVANTTVTIPTPNGDRSMPVVSQCGCRKKCFRASYKEVYYEAMYNKTSRRMERHVREIDVGKCVGACDGVKRQKCVLRDEKDPSVCLMSLIKRKTSCIATSYEKHEFLTPDMDLKTVVTIKSCGCK